MPHDPASVHTVLAGLLLGASPTAAAAAVAAASSCPDRYYRTEAVVWDCAGTSGHVFYSMKPNSLSKAMSIPKGTEDFSVNATCDVDAGMQLVEAASESEFIDYESSRMNNMEMLRVPGVAPAALDLKIQNFAGEEDTAVLSYRYRGIRDCPGVQPGCSPYDEAEASAEVRRWSCWAQGEYPSADHAWAGLGAPEALDFTKAIPWDRFESAWTKWGQRAGNDGWQSAFHTLDSDHDQQIVEQEFAAGYRLCASTSTTEASRGSTSGPALSGGAEGTGWMHSSNGVGSQSAASTASASHAWTTSVLTSRRSDAGSMSTSTDTLMRCINGCLHFWSPCTVALAGAMVACIGTLLACSLRGASKPVYRSLPDFEYEEERSAPMPEQPAQPEETQALLEEPPFYFRPVPKVKTVMATVPKVVMRPLASTTLQATGLVQPFQNMGPQVLNYPMQR